MSRFCLYFIPQRGTRTAKLFIVELFVYFQNYVFLLFTIYITENKYTNAHFITLCKGWSAFYKDLCLDVFTIHRPMKALGSWSYSGVAYGKVLRTVGD